jgi:glycosyltransferase involved in cell wall biosynthesis
VAGPLVVNGRFLLTRQPTGLHRVARNLVDHARKAGMAFEVLAPPEVADPRADRRVWGPRGRLGAHAWEQASLPLAARGRPILSLTNTAPLLARRSATMVHDLAWLVDPQWYRRSMHVYGAAVLYAARRADVVLTPSHAIAAELAAHGVRPGLIRVVRNAVDADLRPSPSADVDEACRRLGVERPYLLVVGWANPRKDVATVATAHTRLVGRCPHRLVLVGPDHPTFGRAGLPTTPTVQVLGFLPDADLRALMSGCAGFLYPTRYEGFGLPPLEARRCGAQVVASDLPVIREATAGSAELVPCGDVAAWERAMERALMGEIDCGPEPAWTWTQAAAALRDGLASLLC